MPACGFASPAMDLGLISPAAAQGFLSFLWAGLARSWPSSGLALAGQIIVSFIPAGFTRSAERQSAIRSPFRGKKPLAGRHNGIR